MLDDFMTTDDDSLEELFLVGRMLSDIDPKLDIYCKMYGASVTHKTSSVTGKIVRRTAGHTAHQTSVFVKTDCNQVIKSYDPSYFIHIFDIDESSSMNASIRGLIEPMPEVQETLKRFQAIEKLRRLNR